MLGNLTAETTCMNRILHPVARVLEETTKLQG
jgi:hypothetical protein